MVLVLPWLLFVVVVVGVVTVAVFVVVFVVVAVTLIVVLFVVVVARLFCSHYLHETVRKRERSRTRVEFI